MMTFRFAIVGAGLTGTSMLCQFIRRLACRAESGVADPPKVHIRVFEKQSVTGPGFPHNERFVQPYHITKFFAHAATQPPANAEKMLALMRSGIVGLVKLGRNYQFTEKSPGPSYEFVYGEQESLRADFRYVIDARGQQRSVHTDTSELARNLIRRGLIHLGEIHSCQHRAKDQAAVPAPPSGESGEFATESVWIEPGSHRVMQVKHTGTVKKSKFLYAVGAMTRGQIIDVSMARGLARSTDRIAEHLADSLI